MKYRLWTISKSHSSNRTTTLPSGSLASACFFVEPDDCFGKTWPLMGRILASVDSGYEQQRLRGHPPARTVHKRTA
jgi:hypothetical protein